MFAYLIIGVELAVIYAFFWYIFLREPKSKNYKTASRESQIPEDRNLTAGGALRACRPHTNDQISNHLSYRAQSDSRQLTREHQHRNSSNAECSCSLVSSKKRGRRLKLAWLPADNLPPGSNFMDRVCHYLGRKLIQISLKAP
jgi:hypothetical protein